MELDVFSTANYEASAAQMFGVPIEASPKAASLGEG